MAELDDPFMRSAYCLTCRYSLKGLTRDTCPECGRTFDRSDRRTFAMTQRRSARPETCVSVAVFLWLLGVIFILELLGKHFPTNSAELLVNTVLIIIPVAFGIVCGFSSTRSEFSLDRVLGASGFLLNTAIALLLIDTWYARWH